MPLLRLGKGLSLLFAFAAFAAMTSPGAAALLASPVLLFLVGYTAFLWWHSAGLAAEFNPAFLALDAERMLTAVQGARGTAWLPRQKSLLSNSEGLALAVAERYPEALEALGKVNPEHLSGRMRAAWKANTAWTHAHLGNTEVAESLAREALRDAEKFGPPALQTHQGILGIVLTCVGKHPEAIALLRSSLEQPEAVAGLEAIRRYYLGEALRAVGQKAEADAECHRVLTLGTTPAYLSRAEARLGN